MNVARHSKRLLAALMASAITVVDVHAAVTDIYNQPLATTSTVVAKPNIMFILDNSGSMANDYMPDDMDNNGRYGFWSPQCNGLAYDSSATVTYAPPVRADGTAYPDANFNAVAADGYNYVGSNGRSSSTSLTVAVGSVTVNVPLAGGGDYVVGNAVAITSQSDGTIWMSGDVTAWDSTAKNLTVNVTGKGGSGTLNSWTVSQVSNLNNSTYYNYTGTQTKLNWTYDSSGSVQTTTTFYTQCQSNIGSTPGSGVFTAVTISNASAAADKQKYANWYAYYRTRRLMARTAVGRAFQALDSKFRVGFTTISDTGATQGTNKFVDIGDFDATKKAAFYSSLYTATGSSNTPLRAALSKVGRYFANKAPGQASDPMQYSCQRNFAILSTDGYWNTGSETSSYGPYQLTTNSAVGQQDGGEAKPMWDGANAVSTTTTTTSTVQRENVVTTTRTTMPTTRYAWTIGSTLTTCGGNNNRYITSIQQQTGANVVDTTNTVVQDRTTTTVHTVVTTNGVNTSDTTTGPTTSVATVSSSNSTSTVSNVGYTDVGGPSSGCASVNGLNSVGLSSAPGTTVYATNSDTTCTTNSGTSCVFNAWSGTNTVQSGPTTNIVSGPTTTTTTNVASSTSGGSSSSLADVAEYYYATDLRTAALNNCTGSVGPDGATHDVCSNSTMLPNPPLDVATHQHMTTYTIGLGLNGTLAYDPNYLTQTSGTYVNLKNGSTTWPAPTVSSSGGDARNIDDLWHAAVNGRGKYFSTGNANALSNALQSALTDVAKAIGSAAGAATNSLEPVAGENNRAFIATYTTVEWTGDIKAYSLDATTGAIDTTTSVWSARAQLEGVSASSRSIRYMQPGTKAMRAFTYANLNTDGFGANFTNFCSKSPTPLQCQTLTATQVTTANTGDNLVNFLRGDATYEAEPTATNPLYRDRAFKLGDIVNASPVYVKKSPLQYTDSGYSSFAAGTATRKGMLYGAANDGMLHAFDASTGNELWAFVPSFVMPNLWKLADTDYRNHHIYFVDGTPVVADIYTGSAWKTILVGGLNSGGRGYYALDITDPDNPAVMWEFTDANMGLTYGNPIITKRADGTWVVAVTSGLNNTGGDGQGHMYLINATTGALVSQLATGAGTASDPSGLSKINAWVDSGTDNTAKRFYGGDLLGNLWRFDFDDRVAPAGAEATKLASFQISSTVPQPITTKPQLTVVTASGGTKVPVVVVATGRYYGTSDITDTTQQSIYAVKDPLADTGWGDVRQRTDMVNKTVTVSGTGGTMSTTPVDWSTQIGWRMDLPQSKERVVTDFVLQFNILTVASAIPGSNECNPAGGASWLYEMNVGSGAPANGTTTVSEYLGAFLVVGMTSVKTVDGKMKIEIVGSDATVRTREPPPPANDVAKVRRSSWRELIN
ncbi:MAG TPA: PilC/PilY family type IV pilus protein [Burkholderiaceae bacterium]|nr:PilC/PilY family type IV pilus protein [Burkholderiaceae bacterium]